MAETETETEGLSAARLAEIEAHVARRHAAGAFHGHTDGQWWSVLDEYQRDTTALVAEVRRLRAGLTACREVLETCDWTGPYSELNAARRACGLPEV